MWGDPKKPDFLNKKKIYLHFVQKTLNPLQNLSIGGNTLVQSFFPPCEASLELLKLDVVECEAVFTSSTVANLCPFNVFFTAGNKKKSQEARSSE